LRLENGEEVRTTEKSVYEIAIFLRLDFASVLCFERVTRNSNSRFAIRNLVAEVDAGVGLHAIALGGEALPSLGGLPPLARWLSARRRLVRLFALIVITQRRR